MALSIWGLDVLKFWNLWKEHKPDCCRYGSGCQEAQAAKPRYIYTDLGKEKLCKHCQEYWPVDSEFWFMVKAKRKDGSVVHRPDSACKGCYDSTYRPNLSKGKYQKRSNHEKGAAA